jgi:chromosome segregation ATPase
MTPADLDALIERLNKDAVTHKQQGWDGDAEWDLLLAATLTRLRDENKERAEIIENHRAARKSAEAELADSRSHDAERQEEWFEAQKRAERAEAEVERLKDALRQANGVRDVFASAVKDALRQANGVRDVFASAVVAQATQEVDKMANPQGSPVDKMPDSQDRVPDDDMVICPGCVHQFRAVPVNVQARIAALEAEVARLTELDSYNTDIIARFEAKLTAAEAERDALRADAERYRWLHSLPQEQLMNVQNTLWYWDRAKWGAVIDAAIDAARKEGK